MPVRPRLIATDLDGTLLAPDGHVSARTRDALERAAAAGVELVVATGRGRLTALPKLESIPAIRWVVCSNGAMVWDRHRNTVHLHRPMARGVGAAVIAGLRANVPRVGIGWETADGFGFDQWFERPPPSIGELGLRNSVAEPVEATEVTKLLVAVGAVERYDQLADELDPHFPDTVTATSSGGTFVEATAAGVDKGSTLASLTAHLGVDATEVWAFGDQHNDMTMLAWAGVGVAMGNAHPEVAAASDRMAGSNGEDGVAAVIDDLLG